MIKYPCAVEIFVEVVRSMMPGYSPNQLAGVLLETIVRAAPRGDGIARCRAQMAALDAQGVC
eukprot:2505072-Lingulodinium_polyedra.AAC.1